MKKILVVDETKTLEKIYFDLLAENYNVEASNDPEEIIPRAQRSHPDLIIINSDLPGFDAHAFCTQIKTAMNIPVVLLLDKHSTSTLQLDGCRADAIIIQPLDKVAFLQTVDELLVFKK